MYDYENVLDIKEIWGKAKREEISLQEFSKMLSNRISNVDDTGLDHIDDMKMQVIEEFEILANLERVDKKDFDEIWEMFYNWADSLIFNESGRNINCHIKTA